MELSEPLLRAHVASSAEWLDREWLVTNGIGGYAFGTVAGVPTRAQHAPLVAAGAKWQREIVAAHLFEELNENERRVALGGLEKTGEPLTVTSRIESFQLELGIPTWRFSGGLEKQIAMPHGENATVVRYRNGGSAPVQFEASLWIGRRGHVEPLAESAFVLGVLDGDSWRANDGSFSVRCENGELFERSARARVRHRVEAARGYGSERELSEVARVRFALEPNQESWLVLSMPAETHARTLDPRAAFAVERARRQGLLARAPIAKTNSTCAQLALAADAFLVKRAGHPSVAAGYPWFTDWGRDTFISLEGLTLTTGRPELAREILLGFSAHARDGLIPNHFSEQTGEPAFNTADATLWFIHALGRYIARTDDRDVLVELRPMLREVIDRHLAGTRFGIGVDSRDGLLCQGAAGIQLTWMDAKVGDHVVTARRGKAVELNALWFQALVLCADWLGDFSLQLESERVARSFNVRFWCESRGHLFDVVDGESGDDASLRPNQLFAISLPQPVLERRRWAQVIRTVRAALLTPVGLRTLAPGEPNYRGVHAGDVHARDAAYHNGTAWPFLLGAWMDSRLALDPGARGELREELAFFPKHLAADGVGFVGEIFSGDRPHAAEGCPAQAWSVAELLRSYERLEEK